MRWIDITLPIAPSMVTYEGDPPVSCRPVRRVEPGQPSSCSVTLVSLSSHTGTHVDAPAHFVSGGACVDEISLDVLCGPARLVDLSSGPSTIDADTLAGAAGGGAERLLIRTGNGQLWDRPFTTEYAHLDVSAAEWLREQGVRLVGIDYLSVEAAHSEGHPVHHALLGAAPPVIIVEGLDLRQVPAGAYELVVLPLRLAGVDGAPARAMVRPLR
ncbi:MAG: cyclase family protein [Deltaproteobacteria bacterium]|jgi:arylformamidase|nr:cyclase family protein [Deltaproteobacteria bacterium]MBW2530230.1 cyclase family protein [Deltaproteobacteria bacterium]